MGTKVIFKITRAEAPLKATTPPLATWSLLTKLYGWRLSTNEFGVGRTLLSFKKSISKTKFEIIYVGEAVVLAKLISYSAN